VTGRTLDIAGRYLVALATGLCLAAAVGGCSSVSEHAPSVYSSSPGKYNLWDCSLMAGARLSYRARRIELEKLMAKASEDAGGDFVGVIAYRTEYEQAAGELRELERAIAEKQCAVSSPFSSGRAVF
jgi:hypothetical protein